MVRYKNRYLTLHVEPVAGDKTSFRLTERNFLKAFHCKLQSLHGDFGVAAVKLGFSVFRELL